MTCSMLAGQMSWQARQVVQAQRASWLTVSIRLPVGLPVGQFTDLLDDLHRRERLVGRVCRAAILAAFAGGAGVGVEDVFPGQIVYGGGAELFDALVFEVDGGDEPFRFKGGQKRIDAGGEDVAQFGVGDRAEEAEHQGEVEPPEDLVGDEQGAGGHVGEELPRQQAAGREAGQTGVQPQFGGGHAGPFDQEPGDQDREQQLQHDVVVSNDFQALGTNHKAADEEPRQHDERQDSGHVQYQRKPFVKFT